MLSSSETPTSAQELKSNDPILTAKNSNRRKKSTFLSTLVDSDPVNASISRIDLALDIEFNIYDNINISQDQNLKDIQADNPLKFFFNFDKKFPELAKLSKEILCIPATSVPSESLFSITGIIQNDQRNRINPSLLNHLNFIKYNSNSK